jgi:NADP-dependent aldehyde dehydrogenase
MVKAAEGTGMPRGVFSMVHGAGNETGMALVKHPAAKAVGFTGSLRGGRALFNAAASRPEPIPVYAEMGSTNPIFVLPGALKKNASGLADGLVQSATLGVGQFCTNPGLVFGCGDDNWRTFVERAGQTASGVAPGVMLHSGISDRFQSGATEFERILGVKIAGKSVTAVSSGSASAIVFTTDAATFRANNALGEELFGPSTLLVQCASRADLEAMARALPGQLTATIHGTDEDLAQHQGLIAILAQKAGRLIFNQFPTGVEVCPSMQHGGPYPATTDSRSTSVGAYAIKRFARPVCFQNFPQSALPAELRDDNPRNLWRLVDGKWGK